MNTLSINLSGNVLMVSNQKNGVIEHMNGNKKDNFTHNLRLVLQNSQKQ